MAKIEIAKTELVWLGKYNEDGTLKEVPRVNLPFQVIETVNESRATREANKLPRQTTLFDVYEGKEGDTFEEGWRNKLIWGDNLLVMGSLLEKFAGKVNLIYIDPPFATGADFKCAVPIGELKEKVSKEHSIIEEKAYRDTWGRGLDSYLQMMYDRLVLMRELLTDNGSIYVHLDWHVGHYVKVMMDEIFGVKSFVNQIIWRKTNSPKAQSKGFGTQHDIIFIYVKNLDSAMFNKSYRVIDEKGMKPYSYEDERGRFRLIELEAQGIQKTAGRKVFEFKGKVAPWLYSLETLEKWWEEGLIYKTKYGRYAKKQYLEEIAGLLISDIWVDEEVPPLQGSSKEFLSFDTQKPEALLKRIVEASSNPGDIVADFFCGSGTSLAVAEKLGRRWLGCDLSRWAVHITRKRLLGIENCKPFEVLNLGKYERQYWQGVNFGEKDDKSLTEQVLYEYLAFILKLYGAQPVAGMEHLHGKKGKAMVHIGAVDAPVTIDEINQALDECVAVKQQELHVLGWEWEMGLAGPNNDVRKGGVMHDVARQKGVKLLLLQIPREVMEEQAVTKGDVKFFELAYFEVEINQPRPRTVQVTLKDFASPNMDDLIPEDIRSKITKWSDYIDYWAIDWNFQNDTFMQGWVAYRTRCERNLPLASDPHTYDKPGKYRILVKVIDIFGNDTSQAFHVEVK